MAIGFLAFTLVVAGVCLLTGSAPDPWKLLGHIKRTREPRRFYLVVGGYVMIGAVISAGSWWAKDSAKHATEKVVPALRDPR